MLSDSGQSDTARLQTQKKTAHIIGCQLAPSEHLHGEGIDARQHRHMRADEVGPPHLLATLGAGAIPKRRRMLPTVDRRPGDRDSPVLWRCDRIPSRYSHEPCGQQDQYLNSDGRSTRIEAVLGTVELLRD